MFPAWSLCLPLLFASASIPDGLSGIQAFRPKSSTHTHTKRTGILMLFQNAELSPLSPQILNALLYCVCIILLPTVWSLLFLPGWPLTYCISPPVLILQSQATCKVRCVLMSHNNDLSPAYKIQYSWHDGKLMNVIISYIHTYTTQGLQALRHICYQRGQDLENSLSITTGSVRMRGRDRRLWWKRRGWDQNVKK